MGEDAERIVGACGRIDEQVMSTLEEGDKSRALWEVFFEHITNCRERNGVKLGIKYHVDILSWLIIFAMLAVEASYAVIGNNSGAGAFQTRSKRF